MEGGLWGSARRAENWNLANLVPGVATLLEEAHDVAFGLGKRLAKGERSLEGLSAGRGRTTYGS